MRQSVVRYAGVIDGNPSFDLNMGIQGEDKDDNPGSANQLDAVTRFYGYSFPDDLTDWQLHCLLCGRDLARACGERLYPKLWGDRADDVARFVACFISQDEKMALAAVDFLVERRDRGEPPEDLAAALATFPHWPAIQQFAADLAADLSEEGYRLGSGPK